MQSITNLGNQIGARFESAYQFAEDKSLFIVEPLVDEIRIQIHQPALTLRTPIESAKSLFCAARDCFGRIYKTLDDVFRPGASETEATSENAFQARIDTAIDQAVEHATDGLSPNSGQPDNLQTLPGVGPATLRKLQAEGIVRFRQIAQPSAEDRQKLLKVGGQRNLENWMQAAREQLES